MLNTYTYSVLWPIRTRNHQGYCSLLPEISETCRSASSRCCCSSSRSRYCCCCCQTPSSSSFVKPKVLSINTGFVLYGLRQSTLIQWPSFRRRLLVGVADGHCCDSELYSRRNRGFRLRVSEEEHGRNCPDDVEAMLSLLSEDLIDEERNWNSVSRIVEGKKVRYGDEFHGGNVKIERKDTSGNGRFTRKTKREGSKRLEEFSKQECKRNGIREDVKIEEKFDSVRHSSGRKNNSQLESDSRRGYRLVSVESTGRIFKRNDEREVRPTRTKSSSCSSYYSLASSGDFESDTEDQDEDVGFHHENLRSSEKKVVEQSTKTMKSGKGASQIHSRRKKEENSSGVGSITRTQVFEEDENSNQVVTLNQRRRKQVSQTSNRVSELTGNYEEDMEIHEIRVNDAESQNQKLLGEREDGRVLVENIDSSQQPLKENLGARYSREERVYDIRRRTKNSSSHEEGVNVNQIFSKATNNQKPLVEERISKQAGMEMSTQSFSEDSGIHDMDIRNTYVSQSKNQIRNQEVDAGLQIQGMQQDYLIGQNPLQTMQSDRTSVSVSQTNNTVRYTETRKKSEKRLIGQGSTTIVQLGSKTEKNGAWKDSGLDHTYSTKGGQKTLGLQMQSSQGKLSEGASSSQSSLTLVSGNRMQLVDLVSEEMQESETTLIPPSSQMVCRGSGKSYGNGRGSIQEISQGTSESGYAAGGAGIFVNSQSTGELMRFGTHDDALGSAHRLEQSSDKFIGEFVKKAEDELSTSETEERRAESNQLKRPDSRGSSGGSGAKGPSDEMWVTDSAQGTPQPGDAEGNAAEGNAIFKRSGRSLWSVIADIARLRWGPRAGSPDSSAKPAGKSSPNESVSSATWFSGREHDGSSDDNIKADRVLPQEAASPNQLEVGHIGSRSRFESSDATKLKQQSGRHESLASSPSFTRLEGGSGSASSLMPPISGDVIVGVDGEEGRDFKFRPSETALTQLPTRLSRNMKRSPAIKEPSESSPTKVSSEQDVTVGEGSRYRTRAPGMDAIQKPLPFPGRNVRSPVVKEPSESRPSLVSGSSSIRAQVEQQQGRSAKSEKETGSAPTDSALTQRKLQRNKQVVRDSFEEWEEAYRVEAERRTADEIFMREALVEAKKAADIWEVPVGAVLVHDGKIIARGFNLVEDLRDSTAHAEMICIREGSKVLRSWRLADTTLYVTLEPCPMCAGAILQARVDTLVWGAPNKLLGADGSWIRLFPGGEGNGSEVSEKPPPPVHPFHPKMKIRRGVLESECAQAMQQFFQLRRKKKDKNSDPPPTTTDHHHHHHHPSKLLNKIHQILPFFCL